MSNKYTPQPVAGPAIVTDAYWERKAFYAQLAHRCRMTTPADDLRAFYAELHERFGGR